MNLPFDTIENLYGLKLAFVEKVEGGFLSDNFVLNNGEAKYFLKKHRHTTQTTVDGISKSERFFAEGGIPVIVALPTADGEDYFEYNSNFYSLYPFVIGRQIPRGTLSVEAARSLGTMLANIHLLGKGGAAFVTDHFRPWNKEKCLARIAAIKSEVVKENPRSDFGNMVLKNLELKKQAVLANIVAYEQLSIKDDHLLHGDYFCDNVFFDDAGEVAWVFDFEKAQWGPALFEMFRSLLVSFLSIPTEDNLTVAREYLRAYLKTYPADQQQLQDAWIALYLKQVHSVWIEEEHYIKHSTRPDSILPSEYARNQYHFANRDRIFDFLLAP